MGVITLTARLSIRKAFDWQAISPQISSLYLVNTSALFLILSKVCAHIPYSHIRTS